MARLELSVHTNGGAVLATHTFGLANLGHVVELICEASGSIVAQSEDGRVEFRARSESPRLALYFDTLGAPAVAAAFRTLAEYAESVAALAAAPERNGAGVGL